jgi:hypothetical protein
MGKYTAEDNRRFAFDCRTEENGQQAIFRYQKLNRHEGRLRFEAVGAEISPRVRRTIAVVYPRASKSSFYRRAFCGCEAVGDCAEWKD